MKWTGIAVTAALFVANSYTSEAFAPTTFVSMQKAKMPKTTTAFAPRASHRNSPVALNMAAGGGLKVGIVGGTGAVGVEILQCLEDDSIGLDINSIRLFGSERSAGKKRGSGKFGELEIELFSEDKARECDVVFLAVGGGFSKEHAKNICAGDDGTIVIDNSSAFRYDPDIPLVVPEINGSETKKCKLIANPNCTTAIALMALWPLHKAFGLKRIIVSTYQAASGAGQPGMSELQDGTKDYINNKDTMKPSDIKNEIFAHPLPFNVIPHIDVFQENGYTKEEMKVTWESIKICSLPEDTPISCTSVRIPTMRAHAESIVVETEKPIDMAKARQVLEEAPGVALVDNPEALEYPMPLTATGNYDVQVGRLRPALAFENGLELFVCGDQLLRGAALNAVLVAKEMVQNGSLQPKAEAAAV